MSRHRQAILRSCGIALLCSIALCFIRPAAGEEVEEAVKVYRQLKPSVVSLHNAEGVASGIILQSDGLILTDAYTACSPLPFEVRVDAPAAGKSATPLLYKKVQIVGYHPRLNLALIRIDPKENQAGTAALHPAVISKTKGDTGQQAYVIGETGTRQMVTKSITSGMISAVDREVDGERYYQTDAAINYGNGGGPLCDRNGNVLGLITFKFSEVSAIGFAIPLHDLDTKAFVPLNKREPDPKRAKELMALADKYYTELKTAKDKGEEKRRNLYASLVYVFNSALALDPANGDLYLVVGIFKSGDGSSKVPAAYFARSAQVAPWGTPYAYAWLGRALVKEKQDIPAAQAWSEGVTKFPYTAQLWEELAIYYIERNRPVDAARCASAAMLVADPDTQLEVLRQLIVNARGKVSGADAIALKEQTNKAYLTAMIDRMVAASNAARAARTLYLSRSTATLLASYGSAPLQDVGKTIPQEPLKRWDEWVKLPRKAASAEDPTRAARPGNKKNTRSAAPTRSDPASTLDAFGSRGANAGSPPFQEVSKNECSYFGAIVWHRQGRMQIRLRSSGSPVAVASS